MVYRSTLNMYGYPMMGGNMGMGMGVNPMGAQTFQQQANVSNLQYNQAVQQQTGGMQMMMNPILQAKFYAVDRDRSGTININEIARAYQQFQFPPRSAKMLLQGITDMPYIDMNTFPMFDQYITSFYNAFAVVCMGRPRIMIPQAVQALQAL